MTDKRENELLADYNKALNELKRCPKGDPRHIRLAAQLVAAQRAIKRYRQIKQARDQNL